MHIRTVVGILLSLVVVVAASYLTNQNVELLLEPFRLGADTTVPLYWLVLGVFLLGFIPTMVFLVVTRLRGELAARRERRREREMESLERTFRRAVDLQSDGQWSKSAAELETLLAARPEHFSGLLWYGEVLRLQGRVDEALALHRRASVLYPDSVALLYQLARDYERAGDAAVATEIHNRVLRDFPAAGLAILRRRRDRALTERDWAAAAEYQEQIAAFNGGAGVEDEDTERAVRRGLDYQRGVQSLEKDRTRQAVAIFRKILDEDPEFIPAYIMLGEAELMQRAESAALEHWVGGFRATGSPIFLQRIEDHFIERGEPARAIETLHSIISETANSVLGRFYLGRLYFRLEMHDDALKALEGVRDRIGTSATYHHLLGRIHARRGSMELAAGEFLEAIKQAGLATTEYVCQACGARSTSWNGHCDGCGAWNTMEVDFEEEALSADGGGLQLPVRAVYGEPPEDDDEPSS